MKTDGMAQPSDLIDTYLAQASYSLNTRKAYQGDLRRLRRYACNLGRTMQDLTSGDLLCWLAQLEAEGCSDRTRARKIFTVRGFYAHLLAVGIVKTDPAVDLAIPFCVPTSAPLLQQEAVAALLSAPDRTKHTGRRNAAMLHLLVRAGLKATEIIELRVIDFDSANFTLTLTKRVRGKVVAVDQEGIDLIQAYLNQTRPQWAKRGQHDGVLFLTSRGEGMTRQALWKLVVGYANSQGIPDVTPSGLRRVTAAHAIRSKGKAAAANQLGILSASVRRLTK